MNTCRQVGKRMRDLAPLPAAELPAAIQRHLAECPACRRALAGIRLARGMVAAVAEAAEPPSDFADRVLRALPTGHCPVSMPPDLWRPAWSLVPIFAALVAGLVLLSPPGRDADVSGLWSTEYLSMSEHLVLGSAASSPDLVLAAVLEDDRP
jgi:hypothetical protein